MARGVFQATVADDEGNVIPSASIEVADESSGSLVQLYDAITGGSTLGNPFNADENGFFQFYTEAARVRVTATSGAFEREWRYVPIGPVVPVSGTFTGTLTGFTTTVTGECRYVKNGDIVTVFVPSMTATSNSTAMTLTGLPSAIQAVRTLGLAIPYIFNSGNRSNDTVSLIVTSGSGTATFRYQGSETGFTSSGTKGVPAFCVTYILT